MGRLIAVLALAGAAAFAAHPGTRSTSRTEAAIPAAVARVSDAADSSVLAAQERDLAGREEELGLVGAAPLFGAEGLPKPTTVR